MPTYFKIGILLFQVTSYTSEVKAVWKMLVISYSNVDHLKEISNLELCVIEHIYANKEDALL